MDSSVPLINHDPGDLGSLILIKITPKEHTHSIIDKSGYDLIGYVIGDHGLS